MQAQTVSPVGVLGAGTEALETQRSGVAWGAIFAGAVAAVALTFLLLVLGTGLGLSALSPWSYNAPALGWSTVAWVALTELASSAIGGYLAGRLRIKWAAHDAEVDFRDTAHGLLSWALATLIATALLAGTLRAVLSGAIDIGGAAANAAAPVAAQVAARGDTGVVDYFSDMLLRPNQPGMDSGSPAMRAEVLKIFANAVRNGGLAGEDRAYLGRIVAQRSGLEQGAAERRVDQVYANTQRVLAAQAAQARALADQARRTAAFSALAMVVALVLGAIVASVAAQRGGRRRDAGAAPLA